MTPYLPNCAFPLIFESEFEEVRYGMAGTGFLVRSNSNYYFITAKHSLAKGDHEKIRVSRSFGSRDLLQLGQFGHIDVPSDEQDTDWVDLAIFSVLPSEFGFHGDTNVLEPAFVPNTDTRYLLVDGLILTARGFPEKAPLSGIDFERKIISAQAMTCDALLIGASLSQCCYDLQFVTSCPISDFNYMSGSPVFAKVPFDGELHYILVGILLRAGGPQKRGQFVSIEVFKRCQHYYADPTKRP